MRQVKILTLAVNQLWKNVYLVQLVWLKMMILISVNILDTELDLIFFSHPSGGTGRNVIIIFGLDMNSRTKIDNTKKIF